MTRFDAAACYSSPYPKQVDPTSDDPAQCYQDCERLYPYDSAASIRYPNMLLSSNCNIRCGQKNPGYERYPDKDVQAIEPFGNFGSYFSKENIIAFFQLIVRYLLEAAAVAVAAYYIPMGEKPSMIELLQITGVAAACFFILDLWAPAVGNGARLGSGFGIGSKMVGFKISNSIIR